MSAIRSKLEAAVRKVAQWRGRQVLAGHPVLWPLLQKYLADTRSTGCGWIDYAELYRQIRRRRPMEVLECGTGVSTLVIAQALLDNGRETGSVGRVTSMEEHPEWFRLAEQLLPDVYRSVVDLRLSPTVEDTYSMFRGVRYAELPKREFEFVFVDGPAYRSPADGTPTFDFDLLHVIRRSSRPVAALIDKRVSTCFVLQQVLGSGRVRYAPIRGLGFVDPCSRENLGNPSHNMSSANFAGSFRLVGPSRLHLEPLGDGP
jgi:Methyltransferase domain